MVIPFSNIKKAYLQILKNLTQFFAHSFIQYQKIILTNHKKPEAIFCLSLFQILKKQTYKSSKSMAQVFDDPFFKYKKKTYLSI